MEVISIGTMLCVPSCGTTTVDMGSETVIVTRAMSHLRELHPAAANANPRKATPRTRRIDRNMEGMRDVAQSEAELRKDLYLGIAGEIRAHQHRDSQTYNGDHKPAILAASGWGANRC
jgi:hypothetical protein